MALKKYKPTSPGRRFATYLQHEAGVRTAWVKPKPKRRGFSKGTRRRWKKAVVTLHPEDSIELFEGQEA